jgi:hypothetical protein
MYCNGCFRRGMGDSSSIARVRLLKTQLISWRARKESLCQFKSIDL